MDWSKSSEDVGFNIKPNQVDLDREMEKQSRTFFVILGVIFLLLSALVLWKNGATAEQFVVLDQKGLILSANPMQGAELAGSLQESGTLVPVKVVHTDEQFTLEAKQEHHDHDAHGSHGAHGNSHADHKDEHAEEQAEAKTITVKGTWFKVQGQLRGETEDNLGKTFSGSGWISAENVAEVKAGGLNGAFARVPVKVSGFVGFALFCIVIGLFAAKAMVPFMKTWFRFVVEPLAWVNTRILLSLVFYLVIAPMALYRRLALDIDTLDVKMNPEKSSYWTDRKDLEKDHFRRRF